MSEELPETWKSYPKEEMEVMLAFIRSLTKEQRKAMQQVYRIIRRKAFTDGLTAMNAVRVNKILAEE